MGRGRAKAKQTKVARQLKYGGPTTDLERLQAELSGHPADEGSETHADEPPEDDDPYADDPYADRYSDIDDDGEDEPGAIAR